MGHVISNLALGVGQSFVYRREGVGHVFFYQPHFQMLWPTPYTFWLVSKAENS